MTRSEYQEYEISLLFARLEKSKFRSRFHLSKTDKQYVLDKGFSVIEKHAYDFISRRLAPRVIFNDGKQTPMRGHPVFLAQHATATCCRGCLFKWHHIATDKKLSKEEIDYVVKVIMEWIKKEVIK